MKKILIFLAVLISVGAAAQKKTVQSQYGFDYLNRVVFSGSVKLPTDSAKFTADLNVQIHDTAQVYYNKPDSTLRIWTGYQWLSVATGSFGTNYGRFGVEDAIAQQARTFTGNDNTYPFTFDSVNTFAVRRDGKNRILMNGGATYLYSPDETANILISDAFNSLMTANETNYLKQNADSMWTPKRISYASNINGSLTTNSLITKGYADSLKAIGQTLQQTFNQEVGGSVLTKTDSIQTGSNILKVFGATTHSFNGIFQVNQTSTGRAMRIDGGSGLYIFPSAGSNGFNVEATSGGTGAIISSSGSSSGIPLWAQGYTGARGIVSSSYNNGSGQTGIITNIEMERSITSGSTTHYVGEALDYKIRTIDGTGLTAIRLVGRLKNATSSTNNESEFLMISRHNSSDDTTFRVLGTGQITFDKYTSGGSFVVSDTSNYKPAVFDANGVMYRSSYYTGGGGSTSLSSVGGGLDIQTGGAGNIRTLNTSEFTVGTNLISIDTSLISTKWYAGSIVHGIDDVLNAAQVLTINRSIDVNTRSLIITGTTNGAEASLNVTRNSFFALEAKGTSGAGGIFAKSESTTTNTAVTALRIRGESSNTTAANFGVMMDMELERDNGSWVTANQVYSYWESAAAGTETARLKFMGVHTNTLETFMDIKYNGIVRVNNNQDTLAKLSDVRAGGGGGTYTFNNGLDNSGGTVGLGGSLGIDRTIDVASHALILDATASGGKLRVQGRNSSVMELSREAVDLFNQTTTTGTWSEIFSSGLEASLYARDNGVGIIRSVKVEGTGTTVTGPLKIVDGTQSNGYVFTSDGSGNGSWQAPTGGGYTTLAQFVGETNWTTGYINGSGDYTELALGSSGKVLTSNGASSAPSWETPGGASWNGLFTNATSGSLNGVTLSETATLLEHTGGTSTTTLPLISATTGHTFFIVNHGSGVLTVNRQSSDNISYHGSTVTTFNLAVGQSCSIMAMSSAWVVWLDGYNPSGGGLSDSDYGDITVSGGGTVMTFDYKRNMVYTTATGTDANITAVPGTAYNLPPATLSTSRTIDVSGLNVNGDYIEVYNNEEGFVWSFTGATVYDSDGATAITELLANTNSIIRRINGKLMISKL